MAASNHLTSFLDAAERDGRLNVHETDIATALPDLSPAGLRQALHRQHARGRIARISRGAGHWLIVPLQFANSGSPPIEVWLDSYFSKTLKMPYYVCLLSAAEAYGASPNAVMISQIMVAKPRREITVGRHQLVFHTRTDISRLPTRWYETGDGRYRISTPELTALDLVRREAQVGGMARVQDVMQVLSESCSAEGMLVALDAANDAPSAQRLGALFSILHRAHLAKAVQQWLRPRKIRTIPLESGTPMLRECSLDKAFKVRIAADFESANT